MSASAAQQPYLIKRIETVVRLYNPEFGNDRMCTCGHTYYRHFDFFEDADEQDVGCKYCGCAEFKEQVAGDPPAVQ